MTLKQLILANLEWGVWGTVLTVTTPIGVFSFTVEDALNERNGAEEFLNWKVESFIENQVTLTED